MTRDRETTICVELIHSPYEAVHRLADAAPGVNGRPRRGGSGVGQVILDIPTHDADLFREHLGELRISRGRQSIGFI